MAAMTQYATGRKSAIARAWVTAAAGDIVVNEKPLEQAFPADSAECDSVSVRVGRSSRQVFRPRHRLWWWSSGQAGALRHAISKALVIMARLSAVPSRKKVS